MRIGILTEIINSHSGARAPLEIGRHLALLGNFITIYAYDNDLDKKFKTSLERDGVKITLLTKNNFPVIGKYLTGLALIKILKQDNLDLCTFLGTPPFFLAGRFSGVPIIRIYQGVQFDAFLERKNPHEKITGIDWFVNKIANLIIYCIDLMSFRLSHAVIAISRFSKEEGEYLYRRKVDAIIYHGTTPFPKYQLKKSKRTRLELISVSRLTPYKGFHLIIEALKKTHTNKQIRLTIVGSQPKKKYLQYLKKDGGIRIVINPSDYILSKLYQAADIYVCADRYLYFGLPIYEAAQFGKAAISLDFAAAKEVIIHGKTGFVAKNTDEMSRYIKILVENPLLRKKLGLNAKIRASYFTWIKCAKKYQKTFEAILKSEHC